MRPKRHYLTEILMERMALQMVQGLPTREVARLNEKSIATIQRIQRLKDFHFVFERVKKTTFELAIRGRENTVERAVNIFKDNAHIIAQKVVDLASQAGVPKAVQLAAGIHSLNRAGVQLPPPVTNADPFLDAKLIEIDRTTTQQIQDHSRTNEPTSQ